MGLWAGFSEQSFHKWNIKLMQNMQTFAGVLLALQTSSAPADLYLCFASTIWPVSQSERQQVLPFIRLFRRGNNTSPTFNNLLGETNAPGIHFIIGADSRDAIIRRRNRRQTSTIWVLGATLLPYLLLRRHHSARRITF